MFKALSESIVSDDVANLALNEVNRKKSALKLSELAFMVAQGNKDYAELTKYYEDSFSKVDHKSDIEPTTNLLSELISAAYSEVGIRWPLDCLNKSLGSLRPGDFGFIFARPETGKTTLLAHVAAHTLATTDKVVDWFNNEEDNKKVALRVYQAFFAVTTDQLLSNIQRYERAFIDATDNRFRLYNVVGAGRKIIENRLEIDNPGLVIYDQLTKINGFNADRKDLELGDKFQWAREVAKDNHAAIGVSQADGTAEGVRYLTMEHVANAKTAVQAEADWILGLGKIHDDGSEYVRFLNLSKNKLLGDPDSIPDLRHGKFEVMIEPSIARYRDIIKFS